MFMILLIMSTLVYFKSNIYKKKLDFKFSFEAIHPYSLHPIDNR